MKLHSPSWWEKFFNRIERKIDGIGDSLGVNRPENLRRKLYFAIRENSKITRAEANVIAGRCMQEIHKFIAE